MLPVQSAARDASERGLLQDKFSRAWLRGMANHWSHAKSRQAVLRLPLWDPCSLP